jgi:hypothetical protein
LAGPEYLRVPDVNTHVTELKNNSFPLHHESII